MEHESHHRHQLDKFRIVRSQISTWHNRAEIARKEGRSEHVEQALLKKRHYENALARIQEFEFEVHPPTEEDTLLANSGGDEAS